MNLNSLFIPLKNVLLEEKLQIADVGSTGGPEGRWKPFFDLCHFYTFDPDPRSKKWDVYATNFPIGLWSSECNKTLYLKRYPPASSFFEINDSEIHGFGFEEAFKTVGFEDVTLKSLDLVLKNRSLDFLKIDAEGSELEILKGAESLIDSSLLGLQLEVFFTPVRKNAPLYGDIEQFLKNKGFFAHQLHREHWIRKNRLYSHQSSPQLIWANALFLPSKQKLKSMLEAKQKQEQRTLFIKFVLILLAYQLYDYAYELCEERKEEHLCLMIKKICRTSPLFGTKLLISLIMGIGKYFLTFSKIKKERRVSYLKRKTRELGSFCMSLGRNNFAVYDE